MGIYDEKEHERKVRNTLIATALEDGFHKGMDEGFNKDVDEEKMKTAKKMKEEGIALDTILKITNLTKEEIEKL